MSDTVIKEIRHRTVFDSRGVETLEVDVVTHGGFARVAAPFGAPGSRGEFEAPAYAPGGLRDSGFAGGMDDEDAWAANLDDFEALEVLEQAKKRIEDEEGIEIRMGLDLAARAMIVKPNQVGTLTGARRTAALARSHGVKIIISNRSGETPDVSIADLAVAWNAAMIKAGVRGGRTHPQAE